MVDTARWKTVTRMNLFQESFPYLVTRLAREVSSLVVRMTLFHNSFDLHIQPNKARKSDRYNALCVNR